MDFHHRELHHQYINEISRHYNMDAFTAVFPCQLEFVPFYVEADTRLSRRIAFFAAKHFASEDKRCKVYLDLIKLALIKDYLESQNQDPNTFSLYNDLMRSNDVRKFLRENSLAAR